MAKKKKNEIDAAAIERANEMWKNFAIASKYSTYATAVILILLALAFVKFV